MLNFRKFTFLYENRIDFLKKNIKTINTSHDALAKHQEPEKIIDHFSNLADPSANKQNTQWIVSRYHRGDFRQEDAPRVKEALEGFHKHRTRLPDFTDSSGKLKKGGDINSYKKLGDLEDALEPHTNKLSKGDKNQIKAEGADLVHEENGTTIHRLKDMNGACAYGKNTKWCTSTSKGHYYGNKINGENVDILKTHYKEPGAPSQSAEGGITSYTIKRENGEVLKVPHDKVGHQNYFHQYDNNGREPLYVIQGKDGEKYQYHPSTGQLGDKKDEPVNMKDLVSKYPEIRNSSELVSKAKGLHSIQLQSDPDKRMEAINKLPKSESHTYGANMGAGPDEYINEGKTPEEKSKLKDFVMNHLKSFQRDGYDVHPDLFKKVPLNDQDFSKLIKIIHPKRLASLINRHDEMSDKTLLGLGKALHNYHHDNLEYNSMFTANDQDKSAAKESAKHLNKINGIIKDRRLLANHHYHQ